MIATSLHPAFNLMRATLYAYVIGGILLCGGCVSTKHNGIKPVSPVAGILTSDCHSLRPTLRWCNPKHTADSRYDVGIWSSLWTANGVSRDERIYYREGITEQEHRVDIKLKPMSHYYWSVRPTRTKTWSSSDKFYYIGPGPNFQRDVYFPFSTPDN